MKVFGAIFLLFMVVTDAGFKEELKKAWRKTKKAIKHAVTQPVKRLGLFIRNKKTSKIVESVELVPFQMTKPFLHLSNHSFDTNTKAEMMKKLQQSGFYDEIIESCLYFEEKNKCGFLTYTIKPRQTSMKAFLTGAEVINNENITFSMKAVRLSAQVKVLAGEVIHWRKVVREYWIHKHEMKGEEYRGRPLTDIETQTVMNILLKALKDDPRFEDIPNIIKTDLEIEVRFKNQTLLLNL